MSQSAFSQVRIQIAEEAILNLSFVTYFIHDSEGSLSDLDFFDRNNISFVRQNYELFFNILMTLDIEHDLAFNNVKPKDWYFVLDLVRFRTGLGYE